MMSFSEVLFLIKCLYVDGYVHIGTVAHGGREMAFRAMKLNLQMNMNE